MDTTKIPEAEIIEPKTPNWFTKNWQYILGALLLIGLIIAFVPNGCNNKPKASSEEYFEKQMDALKEQQQAIKNEYKLRQERKKIDDYLERYSDCDDSSNPAKTCDKCHKKGCDGGSECQGNSGYVDNRVGSPDININIGTTHTKTSASGTKKASGGGYKKPNKPADTSKPDVKPDLPQPQPQPKIEDCVMIDGEKYVVSPDQTITKETNNGNYRYHAGKVWIKASALK